MESAKRRRPEKDLRNQAKAYGNLASRIYQLRREEFWCESVACPSADLGWRVLREGGEQDRDEKAKAYGNLARKAVSAEKRSRASTQGQRQKERAVKEQVQDEEALLLQSYWREKVLVSCVSSGRSRVASAKGRSPGDSKKIDKYKCMEIVYC
jgi:hypothetical protein